MWEMKLPKLEPDPDNFLPGERMSLWRDPYWPWLVLMGSTAGLFWVGPKLLSMHGLWTRVVFFGASGLSISVIAYYGFIAKAMVGGKYGGVNRGIYAEIVATLAILWVVVLTAVIFRLAVG